MNRRMTACMGSILVLSFCVSTLVTGCTSKPTNQKQTVHFKQIFMNLPSYWTIIGTDGNITEYRWCQSSISNISPTVFYDANGNYIVVELYEGGGENPHWVVKEIYLAPNQEVSSGAYSDKHGIHKKVKVEAE